MYVSFFGLKQAPFSIAPDPRYLFMSERHREALAHLLYGLGGGGGFVLLTGEVGAGKTTVCRCFLEQVPPNCHVAYIFNPKLTVTELLQSVGDEFHIPPPPGGPAHATVKDYLDPLNAFLLRAHAEGKHCVLVIDEAQNLSADVLEQLRLLTNLETHERKLLQIVLIGQPELRTLLAQPGLAQLAQRVIARYHLGALTERETAAYVAHRLAVAGRAGAVPFDRKALRRIHRLSGGVPRRINLLCDRALLGAYAEGLAQANPRVVDRAAAEVFDSAAVMRPLRRGTGVALAVGALLAVGAGAVALLGWQGPTSMRWGGAGAAQAGPAAPAFRHDKAVQGHAQPPLVAAPVAASPASALASAVGAHGMPLPSPAPAPAPPAPVEPVAIDLQAFATDERQALKPLLPLWQVPLGDADPCRAALAQQVLCWRTSSATLALLRTLDRPGLLALHTGSGRVYARLAGLGSRHVVLAAGAQAWRVPLEDLAGLWRGEYTTLWRAPPGYPSSLARNARGPAVDDLARALAVSRREPPPAAGQALDATLAQRLAGFQMAAGLKADGLAGPATLMQLNRTLGLAEPRLVAER